MTGRILTTQVGSLPRSKAVTDLVFAAERGEGIDAADFARLLGRLLDRLLRRHHVHP